MGKKRQDLGEGSFSEKMDELYRQAELADKKLGHFMRELNTQFTGVIVHPPLKKRGTAEEKLTRGGAQDDPESLGDICRATIQYKQLETMFSARDFIQTQRANLVDGTKDRYSADNAVASGYRDIKFFIKVAYEPQKFHVCELQLNIGTALVAKELEHPVYEIIRREGAPGAPILIPPGDAAKLGPQLRSVYILTKKAKLLNSAENAALLKVVLAFFLDRATQRLRPGAISLLPADVRTLKTITPKLYKHYQDQALRAKVMTANGFQTQMNQQQLNGLTGNPGHHAHHHHSHR